MTRLLLSLLAAFSLGSCAAPPPASTAVREPGPVARANPVADALNRYRQSRGLARIPVSRALTRVAEAHVADLEANHRNGGRCNMHSWSARGDWSSCCYTPDHAQAACMWDKPKEISGGAYTAPGYEIVAHYSDPMTPAMALEIWQESPAHHAMVLNSGRWADNTWRAVGAAMGENYAVVWFGEAAESAN